MVNLKENKWLKPLFTAYLLIAIIGSFTFSMYNSSCFNSIDEKKYNSGIYIASQNHTVDWLAEETNTIRIANGESSFIFRNGLMRIFLFIGLFVIFIFITKNQLQSLKKGKTSNYKNYILIKLRI
ncbi:MAG: hypothetical protein FWH41_00600 [Treponema sp.]|nr:hypothetical protein [Treponema sp.]